MLNDTKHPEIKVKLVGEDSNVFNLLYICLEAMKKAKLSKAEQKAFTKEATSADYNHFLVTCMKWFVIE